MTFRYFFFFALAVALASGSTPASARSSTQVLPTDQLPHVQNAYFGFGGGCLGNFSQTTLVTVTRSRFCYNLCQPRANRFTLTTCDDQLTLPAGFTWVARHFYHSKDCSDLDSVRYTPTGQCVVGTLFPPFEFNVCDKNVVYTYKCDSSLCNNCELKIARATGTCGTTEGITDSYKCVQT